MEKNKNKTCGYCDCEIDDGYTSMEYGEYGKVCLNCYEGLTD